MTTDGYTIRILREPDAAAFFALRREALDDTPLAFAASPEDDTGSDVETVRRQLAFDPVPVVFGAFDADGKLVGSVGLFRDRHVKAAHNVHIWGMYVRPTYRRRGIARRLLYAALERAARLDGATWVRLSVTDDARAARRLYESVGFRVWGSEPDALRHGGRSVYEHHMTWRIAGDH